jgi:flagellar export protein FliJ
VTFRLQRILDLKRWKEEQQRQRLGAAARARLTAERRLHELQAEERRRRETMAALLAGGRVDAARVLEAARLLDAVTRAVAAQARVVAERRAAEEVERARLVEAMRERQAFDRLRERHAERERDEHQRRETALLGEIANARAARRCPRRAADAPAPMSAEY